MEQKTPKVSFIRNTDALKKMRLKKHFNKHVCIFVGDKITSKDKDLFFSYTKDLDRGYFFLHYKNDPFWSAILRDIGIVESVSEANGAGWKKKVDEGFNDYFFDGVKQFKAEGFGKRPHRITILKRVKKDTPSLISL